MRLIKPSSHRTEGWGDAGGAAENRKGLSDRDRRDNDDDKVQIRVGREKKKR